MATMLTGAAIMDGALLLVSANETCPQPQTQEHLAAIDMMKLKHIIIVQNKIDLVQENVAVKQHEAIQEFIKVVRKCSLFKFCLISSKPYSNTNTIVLPGISC